MSRYQVMLTPELDAACQEVANDLNMSMEQVLSSAVQLYMQRLTLESYQSFTDIDRARDYRQRYKPKSE